MFNYFNLSIIVKYSINYEYVILINNNIFKII